MYLSRKPVPEDMGGTTGHMVGIGMPKQYEPKVLDYAYVRAGDLMAAATATNLGDNRRTERSLYRLETGLIEARNSEPLLKAGELRAGTPTPDRVVEAQKRAQQIEIERSRDQLRMADAAAGFPPGDSPLIHHSLNGR